MNATTLAETTDAPTPVTRGDDFAALRDLIADGLAGVGAWTRTASKDSWPGRCFPAARDLAPALGRLSEAAVNYRTRCGCTT